MGLARRAIHPSGDHSQEGSPAIDGACFLPLGPSPSAREGERVFSDLGSLFYVCSLEKGGGIVTCAPLEVSLTYC